MSEIAKLYKNAGVKKHWNSTPYGGVEEYYPPFTAEKQVAILQTLIFSNKAFSIGRVYPHNIIQINNDKYVGKGETFGKGLAEIINKIWQDLIEEEKQQVKGILG